MSKSLKGTQTAQNLLKSFATETEAAIRYEYYAKQADKDGYVQISNIFQETADNEKQHGKEFYRFLNKEFCGQEIEMEIKPVAITLDSTLDNLKAAQKGEYDEMSNLYPKFADVAEEEGFSDIAKKFRDIAEAERNHEKRYRKLIENIENDRVFKRDSVVKWKCNVCGYIHEGKEPPEECPSCDHPYNHFEEFKETY